MPQAVLDRAEASFDYARHYPHIRFQIRIRIDEHHDLESGVASEARIILMPTVEAIITARHNVRPGADLICAIHGNDSAADGCRKIKVFQRRTATKYVA